MKTARMTVELSYDEDAMYSGDDEQARAWFFNEILRSNELLLHSVEVGDTLGTIRVISVEEPAQEG